MICKQTVKTFCDEYWDIENYDLAINDDTQTWHCHHKKEEEEFSYKELKDLDLYYHRPANELIFLTEYDHKKIHGHLRVWSDESRKKCSINNLGKHRSEEANEKNRQAHLGREAPFKGHKHTPEANEKNRQAHLGKKYSEETQEKKRQAMLAYWKKRKQQKNI